MATHSKFKAYPYGFVRDKYWSDKDKFKLSEKDVEEILGYKDISEKFIYHDWFGNDTNITATLKSVEKGGYDSLIFNIETNKSIPLHYFPSPSDILKGKNLLFPTSYQQL